MSTPVPEYQAEINERFETLQQSVAKSTKVIMGMINGSAHSPKSPTVLNIDSDDYIETNNAGLIL
jgi:hypothetical protein